MPTPTPIFRDLTPDECRALLGRNSHGRIALSHKDRVDIVPIHYVLEDGWLYCRTSVGNKLEMATHNRWVAFQADEVEGLFDWQSVVVKGGLYLLRKEGSADEAVLYQKGLEMVRRLIPESMSPTDPVPERAIIFRIHIDEITGRAASTR